ncbi:MAG: glyoxalase [Propionibacteriaceae bacterium]|jgi:predicted enzyme related to lactoylglutathione lyase|nr:glyoxalase [Propionibacteriaceae bacterium]
MFSVDANEVILYVEDQDRARTFYIALLAIQPSLDVPGMTEFDLGGMTLGLMPQDDILQLLPNLQAATGQRCELYLRRPEAEAMLGRLIEAGGRLVSPLQPRSWGENVGYGLDPDQNVIALAAR